MYVGWIPNASGYLSFSHIGGMPVRNRTFGENVYPPTKFLTDAPYISLLQERNLSDKPTIGKLTVTAANGHLLFLLQAELVPNFDQRKLIGLVFCVPDEFGHELKLLHLAARQGAAPSALSAQTAIVIADLIQKLGNAFFAVKFELHDDGVVEMDSAVNAGPSDAGGPLRAFEAYSFLKDVLHHHRFHRPSDDALLELSQCQLSDTNQWASGVRRNLHRSVISSFRSGSASAQADGLGKLAYLESFDAVLKRRNINTAPAISTESLRSAIEAYQTKGQLEKEERSLAWAYLLSLSAIAIPILFICLQLLQIPCIDGLNYSEVCGKLKYSVPPDIIIFTGFVLRNLDWMMLCTILVAAIVVLALSWRKLYAYNADKLNLATWTTDLRDLVFRIAISHRRKSLAFLVSVIFVVLALSAEIIYYLLGKK